MFMGYTLSCFNVLKSRISRQHQQDIFDWQTGLTFTIHFMAFLILILQMEEVKYVVFYIMQVTFLAAIQLIYKYCYKSASRLVVNNMCMLLATGFIILTRLNYDKAMRQYQIAVVALILTAAIPFGIDKIHFLQKLSILYAIVGMAMLGVVTLAGSVSYGAKISISVAGIAIQPSEFVKILYVFFLAATLSKEPEIKDLLKISVIAGLHVLILVASKDLGAALIFFIVYLFMVYVSTKRLLYFICGIGGGVIASVLGGMFFQHVKTRVIAWQDPLSVIDKQGYQICQSLFAIGSGSWFGRGLTKGAPNTIPVVEQDFVFAAISEEMGGIYALCLILVCVSCFFMFMNISMQMQDDFYKLIALGLGTVYGFQVFLTIGGVTKFIPSTGVTLPFISYGGSSMLSTMILFAIIQGLYILREDGGDRRSEISRKKRKTGTKRRKTQFDTQFEEL